MADISKITVADGNTYNLKDAQARSDISDINAAAGGSATNPVYFVSGRPTACTYELNKTVPADAVFTDTTYVAATTSDDGLMSSTDKTKLNNIAEAATKNSFYFGENDNTLYLN